MSVHVRRLKKVFNLSQTPNGVELKTKKNMVILPKPKLIVYISRSQKYPSEPKEDKKGCKWNKIENSKGFTSKTKVDSLNQYLNFFGNLIFTPK